MRRSALLLMVLSGLVQYACVNLDSFIFPAIFRPIAIAEGDSYLLGAGTNAEFYNEVAARTEWDDAVLFDNIQGSYTQHTLLSGGYTLYGYHLQHLIGGTGKTILFFHGNYMNIDRYWPRSKLLYVTGSDVFIIDYRGYGKSEGEPTEQGLLEDGEAALEYLVNTLGVARTNILIYGYSLGSVPATHIAAYADMDESLGLVLEAPIGSVEIFIQDATYLPIRDAYLTEYRLDNVRAIQDVSLPLLWLHGTADQSQPHHTHGQAVFDQHAGTVKHQKLVPGAAHSQAPLVMDPDFSDYIAGISNFMTDQTLYPFP